MPVLQITLTSLFICALPVTLHRGALSRSKREHIQRYTLEGELLLYRIDQFYSPRTVIANEMDLRARIIYEYHDAPVGGRLGPEKRFAAVSRDLFWPYMYKWVRNWIRTCEICQRVKPSSSSAPVSTDGTLAFLLFRVQLRRALQTRQG